MDLTQLRWCEAVLWSEVGKGSRVVRGRGGEEIEVGYEEVDWMERQVADGLDERAGVRQRCVQRQGNTNSSSSGGGDDSTACFLDTMQLRTLQHVPS